MAHAGHLETQVAGVLDHPSPCREPLSTWYRIVSKAVWSKPNDVKEQFGSNVDFVADNRAIFDIGGNKYRLVVRIVYAPFYRVMVKFVGTHEEYDKIDPETV
jgi:mRNA interferase HigB